ncbi:hypothetical protein L1987_27958 [Smallanthus sonchifolius]|uniref:Uncharacterized protein n=1 Tax=Smallanthus sonchifolius TaxID=185202 RepID=A0ACB9IBZ8_9ASTR|nr:hypothetical protein L1987_27958 [Smallanthus sonchifolius]
MGSCGALKGVFLFSPLAKDGYRSCLLNPSANATGQSSKRKVALFAFNNNLRVLWLSQKENAVNGTTHIERVNGRPATVVKYSGEKPATPILDTINDPINMRNLGVEELEKLANELREEIVYTVSKTGGHLSSNLGVTELTVSLHHVFNTPDDKIIWDVGHQVTTYFT